MNPNANDLFQYNDTREKEMWDNCIFVFDSSALLDFYSVPKIARDSIYSNILTPHKNRFWIPGHVQFEFLKNREKVIVKPIIEHYEPLKINNLKKIEDGFKQIENQIVDLQNKVKDSGTHPHFDGTEIEAFKVKGNEYRGIFEDMNKAVNARIGAAIKEIRELSGNDDVLIAFQKSFEIGRDYSFEEIYKITEEGRHRYQFKIPPGYKDLEDTEKIGTQIFGDLIIWKQILEYGKEAKKPIIFICDDLKEDWCHLEKRSGGEKRIATPREELIKEFHDFTGFPFWMYNLPQFLHLANKYWSTAINESDIKNVAEAIATRNQPKIELDLIYEGGGRSPRGYSNKNPIEMENGQAIMNIGAGIKPIIHWFIDWRLELRVYNNSSYPAFNIKIESIGQSHFSYLEELRPVNNIKPFEHIGLQATFNQELESIHTEADELLKHKIPQALNGLLLKITYFDENRDEFISHMKIENGKLINFDKPQTTYISFR
jgi:hypothetical protein